MHPSPDVLALLSLGEEAGTAAEREHTTTCEQCRAEIADLARAVLAGREGRAADAGLVTPPDRVWSAIRAELGFGAVPTTEGIAYGAHGLREIATQTARPRHARAESNGASPEHGVESTPEPARTPEPESTRTPEPSGTPEPESTRTMEPESTRTPEPTPPVEPAIAPEPARAPEVTSLNEARAARSSRSRRFRAVAVAAALALLVGAGLGFGLDRVLSRQTILWTADLQAQPDFTASSGRASVVEDGRGNRTLQIKLDSPAPVDGSRQVWLIDRGISRLRSVGYITGDSGQWPLPADLDPKQFPVVDVSKEPPNDADLAHSKVSIVRGTLNT